MNFKKNILELFLKMPFLNRYSHNWYRMLGINFKGKRSYISNDIEVSGDYENIYMDSRSEINKGCFLLAKDVISIGENSTLAYQVTILTSANPNAPHNRLALVYKPMTKPVTIGDNVWIGARATILPGVTIGSYSVVAAGSVVTKNVLPYSVVAGVPAKEIKKLDKSIFCEL